MSEATNKKMVTVLISRNDLGGLVSFAKTIDPTFLYNTSFHLMDSLTVTTEYRNIYYLLSSLINGEKKPKLEKTSAFDYLCLTENPPSTLSKTYADICDIGYVTALQAHLSTSNYECHANNVSNLCKELGALVILLLEILERKESPWLL